MPGLIESFRSLPDWYQIAFFLYVHLNKSEKISLFLFCFKRKLLPLNFHEARSISPLSILFLILMDCLIKKAHEKNNYGYTTLKESLYFEIYFSNDRIRS